MNKRKMYFLPVWMIILISCPKPSINNDQLLEKLNWLRAQYFYEKGLEGITLSNCTLTSFADQNIKIGLYELASDGNKIIFRITGLQCQECIDMVLEKLNEVGENIGRQNIVVIGSFLQEKDFLIYKKNKNFRFDFYSTPFDALNYHLDGIEKPYIFLLDSTFTAKMLIIPDRKLPDVIDINLNIMQKRLDDFDYSKL